MDVYSEPSPLWSLILAAGEEVIVGTTTLDPFFRRDGYEYLDAQLDKEILKGKYPPAILIRLLCLRLTREFFFGRNDFRYLTDPKQTAIIIKDGFLVEEDVKQKKPAIVLNRASQITETNVFTDDLMVEKPVSEEQTKSRLLLTNLVFNCISTKDLEAELIASIVYGMLRYFNKQFTLRGLQQLSQITLGQRAGVEGVITGTQFEAINYPVFCRVAFQDTWRISLMTEEDIARFEEFTGRSIRGLNIPPHDMKGFTLRTKIDSEED